MVDERLNVFTYGSLMYPQVWSRVVSGAYRSSVATIHGFRRLCIRDETYPVLVVAKDASPIFGRIYYDVSAQDVCSLDAFETTAYARVTVAVTEHADPRSLSAQAYLGLHTCELTEIDWDPESFEQFGLEPFLAGYAQAHCPTART